MHFNICTALCVAQKKNYTVSACIYTVSAWSYAVGAEITQKVQEIVRSVSKNYAASRNFLLPAVATVATNITSGNTGRQRIFMAPIDPWLATTQAEPINPATNNRQDELIGTH